MFRKTKEANYIHSTYYPHSEHQNGKLTNNKGKNEDVIHFYGGFINTDNVY